jgi:TfoX/Sxy family transcriptional regulator of competence genes
MAYNEKLADRIREALSDIGDVEEKKMFRGVTFMVNGKMCVTVGHDEMMCRIDPAEHEAAIQRRGCRTMIMKGREYKGYVLITEEGYRAKKDFDHWIALSLAFNKYAKSSKTKRSTKRDK